MAKTDKWTPKRAISRRKICLRTTKPSVVQIRIGGTWRVRPTGARLSADPNDGPVSKDVLAPFAVPLFLFSPRTDPCSGMMVGSIYFIVFESSTVRELLGKVFHVAEPIWCDTLHCEFGHFDAIVTLVFSSYASPIAIHEENFSKLNTVLPKKMRSFLRSHLRFFLVSVGYHLKFHLGVHWGFV